MTLAQFKTTFSNINSYSILVYDTQVFFADTFENKAKEEPNRVILKVVEKNDKIYIEI